jgi:hypothetical protein
MKPWRKLQKDSRAAHRASGTDWPRNDHDRAVSLHPENDTRYILLPVSDSQGQTRRVLRALAASANDNRCDGLSAELDQWHALQEWLDLRPNRVFIPYSTDWPSYRP